MTTVPSRSIMALLPPPDMCASMGEPDSPSRM